MNGHRLIKVIKRAERERSVKRAAGCAQPESPAREEARALAATVKQWIGESRQSREALQRESRRQLGLTGDEVHGPQRELVSAPAAGEE